MKLMNATILTGGVAFCASACLAPVVRSLARRWELYDRPGELKIHAGAIPRVGGVAIGLAFLAALLTRRHLVHTAMTGFMVGLTVVFLSGLVDDLRGLRPAARLAVQAIAGGLLYYTGWQVALSDLGMVNVATTIALVLWFVNAFNFVDGSDGLAAGLAAVAALGFVFIFVRHNLPELAAISAALFGSCAGFLFLNFPRATIFMGDCGSTMLGLVLVSLTLAAARASPTPALGLSSSLLFAAVPLADALFAIIRRLRRGQSPFSGDRRHFYDLLLRRGLSSKAVAIVSYLVGGISVAAGILSAHLETGRITLVLASCAILILGTLLGSFKTDPRQPGPARQALVSRSWKLQKISPRYRPYRHDGPSANNK